MPFALLIDYTPDRLHDTPMLLRQMQEGVLTGAAAKRIAPNAWLFRLPEGLPLLGRVCLALEPRLGTTVGDVPAIPYALAFFDQEPVFHQAHVPPPK